MEDALFRFLATSRAECEGLEKIIAVGFCEMAGCYFLKDLIPSGEISTSKFQLDKTGMEAYINHLHMGDYVEKNTLEEAVIFTAKLIKKWKMSFPGVNAVFCISSEEDDASVRFYCKRAGEEWLSDNLEGYLDAVLRIDI